ncbi:MULTISPECIES: hypothetical protein [Pectobacterium]|uniref:hypothetical protein n=1 Tax=Pectobacterium TaxID=122277 RepID=UPI000E72C0B7|nr:hypothetical protein [Pectobacterium versatile]RJL49058.1 hypothetical protein D5073_20575 [Pectobacterium versatile]RJL54930.1 hypothetical protein D5076_17840 [Pectobacterium versatile]RJL56299.1 hypothetical protein D5080_21710 [Pectobacterium versatile]GKW33876.1 hypothetical protein PEC730217_26560 [Pectobacterium carotovorum subsp. carotovorum]
MAYEIEDAFDSEGILEYSEKDENTYVFSLKDIPVEITVRLTKTESNSYRFELSHYIHTPEQLGPYRPSRSGGDDREYALYRAVTAITFYYDLAIGKGHKPSAEWIVPA